MCFVEFFQHDRKTHIPRADNIMNSVIAELDLYNYLIVHCQYSITIYNNNKKYNKRYVRVVLEFLLLSDTLNCPFGHLLHPA